MGLFTALLTLPLAPVRGTVWIAEKLQEQAELELYDESAIEAGLLELQVARESGAYEESEIEEAEDALIERLMELRGYRRDEANGGIE
jgi:Gas vesicle protein G